MEQKPLELILARNFLTNLSTPAFLVDAGGALIFYNEAAGALLGISFEEFGRKAADGVEPRDRSLRRGRRADPDRGAADDQGAARRAGRRTAASRSARSSGEEHEIEASALPIVAEGGQEGAMIFFWPRRTRVDVTDSTRRV